MLPESFNLKFKIVEISLNIGLFNFRISFIYNYKKNSDLNKFQIEYLIKKIIYTD